MKTPEGEKIRLERMLSKDDSRQNESNIVTLKNFYVKHSPRMLPHVERTLARWQGKERSLAERMATKYKTDAPDLVITSSKYPFSPTKKLSFESPSKEKKSSSPVFRRRLLPSMLDNFSFSLFFFEKNTICVYIPRSHLLLLGSSKNV